MKTRFLVYSTAASIFSISYWYIPIWGNYLPFPANWHWIAYVIWLIPASTVAIIETKHSQQAYHASLAMTFFWIVAVLLYYIYYVFVVIPPFSGPNWIYDAFSFFAGAPLRKIILWGTISIFGGLIGGYFIGHCYLITQSYVQQRLGIKSRVTETTKQ
jgi:hypothetical protein